LVRGVKEGEERKKERSLLSRKESKKVRKKGEAFLSKVSYETSYKKERRKEEGRRKKERRH
jgi:hypothetical protein